MASRVLSTALLLLASLPCYAGPKPADLPQSPQVDCVVPAHPVLIGEIVIVGNERVPQDLILSRLPFSSGQILSEPALRMAEDNLAGMDLFQYDPAGTGIRPTVTVLDPDGPAVVKDILVEVQERCGAVLPEVEDILVQVEETRTGGLLFGVGVNSDAGQAVVYGCSSPCGGGSAVRGVCGGPTCDADKPSCSCDKNCSCCGCQKVQKDEDLEVILNCNCGEGCKCCDCKKTIAAQNRAEGCCPFTFDCCASGAIGCFLLEHYCPTLKVCGMCPVVQVQVRQAMQPCVKQFFAVCKQMYKQSATGCGDCCKDSGCCAEGKAAPCGECCKDSGCRAEAKAAKKAECRGHIRVEVRVCPWASSARKAGFVWKHGQKFEKLTVMPQEEVVQKAAVQCPYCPASAAVQQPKKPGLACTPLENLAKMEKARRIMSLADLLYESGKYDLAIKRYRKVMELVPGSQWDAQAQDSVHMAQAMKGIDEWYAQFGQQVLDAHLEEMQKSTVEEAEPIQEKPLPCEPCTECQAMQEYKEKFCALLDQARCAVEAGDIDIAKKLVLEASQLSRPELATLLEAARECLTAGCHEEAWDKVNHVLMLDPNCLEAQDLQRQLIDIAAGQCDQCPNEGCEQEEPPCYEDGCAAATCPGIGFRPALPVVDPSIVAVMERVLIECARPDRYAGDCEEQALDFDDEACELQLIEEVEFCQPVDMVQLGKMLHRFDETVQECVKNAGKWSRRIEVVRFGQVECALTMEKDGTCCVVVSVLPRDAQDLCKWQQVYHKAVRKWVEQMTAGDDDDDDVEESEEPLYQLETDLDPDW